ncbi:hypothetical protein SDC49_01030 [Lactobacillus sp. R2/2]|nr:hypothetical protein [Lactobacillus sp. R2/2]
MTELQALNPIFSKYQLDEPIKDNIQGGREIAAINISAKNLQIAYHLDKPVFKNHLILQ